MGWYQIKSVHKLDGAKSKLYANLNRHKEIAFI